MRTAADVTSGDALWSCEAADALAWLRGLPDDSVDLMMTSPPYMSARTYGVSGVARGLDEWVRWMTEVVTAAAPKVRGLIAVTCEGQTKNYRYHPAPFLLAADLHRAGFHLRKPPVFQRYGIPGSGGPDWLRNDYEPIICVTRPGKLRWSDNTACGHPPKWAPGGAMSHRLTDGTRVGKWGRPPASCGLKADGSHIAAGPDAVAVETVAEAEARRATAPRSGTSGDIATRGYDPPTTANPGNVIRCVVGGHNIGSDFAHENEAPMPLKLAEFFVRSFCPPGGVVADPFTGSGTTAHAAILHGRRFIGCDLRPSQVELTGRRLRTVTPDLFPT